MTMSLWGLAPMTPVCTPTRAYAFTPPCPCENIRPSPSAIPVVVAGVTRLDPLPIWRAAPLAPWSSVYRCRPANPDPSICLGVHRALTTVIGESGESFREALRRQENSGNNAAHNGVDRKRSDRDVHDVVVGRHQLVAHLQAKLEANVGLLQVHHRVVQRNVWRANFKRLRLASRAFLRAAD